MSSRGKILVKLAQQKISTQNLPNRYRITGHVLENVTKSSSCMNSHNKPYTNLPEATKHNDEHAKQ